MRPLHMRFSVGFQILHQTVEHSDVKMLILCSEKIMFSGMKADELDQNNSMHVFDLSDRVVEKNNLKSKRSEVFKK